MALEYFRLGVQYGALVLGALTVILAGVLSLSLIAGVLNAIIKKTNKIDH